MIGGRHPQPNTALNRVGIAGLTSSATPLGAESAASAGAAIACFATTAYVTLFNYYGIEARPVQAVPVLLCLALPFLPYTHLAARTPRLRSLPIFWGVYMVGRSLLGDTPEAMTAFRALTCVLIYFCVFEFSIRQKTPKSAAIALIMGCAVSTIISAADITVLDKVPRFYGSQRWAGWMPGPNRYADLCGLASILCLAFSCDTSNRRYQLFWRCCLALCGAGLVASGSRGGVTAAVVAAAITIASSAHASGRRFRFTSYIKPLLALTVLVGIGLYFFGGGVSQRLVDFASFSAEGKTRVEDDPRREIAAAAIAKFLDSPIVGSGSEHLDLGDYTISSHNSYLYLLSTSGVIGFLLYGGLVFEMLRSLARLLLSRKSVSEVKWMASATIGGLVFLMIHMFVIDLIFSAHVWAFLGFGAAVAARGLAINHEALQRALRPEC